MEESITRYFEHVWDLASHAKIQLEECTVLIHTLPHMIASGFS
jgi:hypothetical protein